MEETPTSKEKSMVRWQEPGRYDTPPDTVTQDRTKKSDTKSCENLGTAETNLTNYAISMMTVKMLRTQLMLLMIITHILNYNHLKTTS